MKQILVILGLLVLLGQCEVLEEPTPNPLPPPFPPLVDGQVEVPWNGYDLDQKSLAQHMQDFPTQYPIAALKVLIFDLRQNSITNMNGLSLLSQYVNLQELTIDLSSQQANFSDLGDMTFVKSLPGLKKFDLRVSGNQLTNIKQINQFQNPSLLTRLSYDFSFNFIKDISALSLISVCSNLIYLTVKVNQNFLTDISVLDNAKVLQNLYQLTIYSYSNQGATAIDLTFLSDFNYQTKLYYFYGAETLSCTLYGHYIDTTMQISWGCNSCYQPCSRCFGYSYDQCLDCANKNVYYYVPRTHQCSQILPNITADGSLIFKYEKAGFTDLEMTNLMQNFATYYTDYSKIKQLYLYLNDNNITSLGVDQLQQLTYYRNVFYLEIWLNNQVPSLLDISPLYLTKQMPIQTLILRFSQNAMTSTSFIKPLFKQNNGTLVNFQLYLDGNSLTDISAFSGIGSLVKLQTFLGKFEGQLTDLSALASFRNCPSIQQITFYFTQKTPTVKTDYTFLLQYNYILTLQTLKTYEGKVTQCDMTQIGQFISVSADKNSWSCSQCYKYCSKCFGPSDNQCIACRDAQRLVFNPTKNTCDFKLPPIDANGTVSINFNSFQITDPLFAVLISQFQTTYDVNAIKHLIFDIRDNQITSFAGMSMLNKYVSIQTMELSFLEQATLKQLNYTIIQDFSQKLTNMDDFILDMRQCDTTQNFINVFDYGNQWKCTACTGQCQKCFGTGSNQCTTCIDNPILHYNPSTHVCEFVLPFVVGDYLYIDLSNLRLQDAQLAGLMTQFVSQYPKSSFHHLDFIALCNPQLTNYSPLSQISATYTDLIDVEFQLKQTNAPYQQDITFVTDYNNLATITNIEMNWIKCGLNQYITVQISGSPQTYKAKCLDCFPSCLRCFGPAQTQCSACRAPCVLDPSAHTCKC